MHTTVVTKYEKLSNGQFAVTIRCCGDAMTDSVHTMDVSLNADDRKKSIADARERVATLHRQHMEAEDDILGIVGEEKQH